MRNVIVYININVTKPVYIYPIIIDFDWAEQYSLGFGISDFGVAPFGDPE